MKKSPILEAIDQICEEKHISKESVLATIEAALAVAYRKDFADKKNQNIQATFDPETAASRIFDVKEVVEDELFVEYEKQREEAEKLKAEHEAARARGEALPEKENIPPIGGGELKGEGMQSGSEAELAVEEERRFDPKSMIPLAQALTAKKDAKIGDIIKTELYPPEEYGRMAAQTAKQVIIQRLREAEREMTFAEYQGKVGEILTGTVQRVEGRMVLIDLGHATGVMPPPEQIERERYTPGQRIKIYLAAVNQTTRGPEIIVSRAHPDMVRKLFAQEVPEVTSGAITIKGVAREAGSRTKVAVYTTEPNIDPVGSCVGQRGTRVQTVIAELGGEKIDIIQYEDDQVRYLINALSPAKVISVKLNEAERRAVAEVKEDQLSFAIGRAGQNVRLAARLTGWRIDIVKESTDEIVSQSSDEVASGSSGEVAGTADATEPTPADGAGTTAEAEKPVEENPEAPKTEESAIAPQEPAPPTAESVSDAAPADVATPEDAPVDDTKNQEK